jgi:hypothetical protein
VVFFFVIVSIRFWISASFVRALRIASLLAPIFSSCATCFSSAACSARRIPSSF